MTESERQTAIAALQARRAARGMSDPLNRLSAHINAAIANGEKPIEGEPATVFASKDEALEFGYSETDISLMTNDGQMKIQPAAVEPEKPIYQTEFADFDPATMPAIPAGFVDTSWHNDVCPSFTNETAGLVIYVDYADSSMREFTESKRFTLHTMDNGAIGDTVTDSDDWSDIVHAVAAAAHAQMWNEGKRIEAAKAYLEHVNTTGNEPSGITFTDEQETESDRFSVVQLSFYRNAHPGFIYHADIWLNESGRVYGEW